MFDPATFAVDDLSLKTILLNLSVAAVLAALLKWHFEHFSSALSSKGELARILPFLTLIVCLIISVVKSSLALSLGLVGALSIVRFRTPIKEPEELVYLFMAIAIGLGLGANQTLLTIVATCFILLIVAGFQAALFRKKPKSVYLTVNWERKTDADPALSDISQFIADRCRLCDLKRADRSEENAQVAFHLNLNKADEAFSLLESLQKAFPHCRMTMIDQSKVPGV